MIDWLVPTGLLFLIPVGILAMLLGACIYLEVRWHSEEYNDEI